MLEEGKLTENQYQYIKEYLFKTELKYGFNTLNQNRIHKYIYLYSDDTNIIQNRINKRNRDMEKGIPIEYL